MTKEKVRNLRLLFGISLLLTFVCALIFMFIGIISIINNPSTSFPWYFSCFLTLVYFGIPLFGEFVLWFYFYKKYQKLK